jgi:predicted phosphodiesterase
MPRDRTVALFQAAMDEYLDQKLPRAKNGGKASTSTPRSKSKTALAVQEGQPDISIFFKKPTTPGSVPPGTKAPFAQFSNLDPGWASVAIAAFAARLRGKAKFVTHKSLTDFRFELPEQTTVALVSDWGGGNDAARTIAAEIKKHKPNYVIHLGDIYYAGTDHEVKKRFLDLWDFETTSGTLQRTFALNGNHEMYSGGQAYFKAIKSLKQPASYFALGNKHWRLIGLDTAYVDHDLNKEQLQWLAAQLTGTAKNVLLSHHQPFSAFESTNKGEHLCERLSKHLDNRQIYGWIWGHEHLCVVYEDRLGFKGRCIGHGCIPYNLPDAPQSEVKVRWWNTRQQNTFGNRGMQGFALLNINGASMHVEYIDKDGTLAYEEDY